MAALAPMTPPPRASLLPHGAVTVLPGDPSPVKIEAPFENPAAAPRAACKREPPTPRWRPEHSRVYSYTQVRSSRQRLLWARDDTMEAVRRPSQHEMCDDRSHAGCPVGAR